MVAVPKQSPARAPRKTHRRRAKTLRRADLKLGVRVLDDGLDKTLFANRPQTRPECKGQTRPCPWVGCKYHLYLDVNPDTGSIKLNFPNVRPDQLDRLPETCALDVADRGGITLEEVAELMQVTRERIRQVEARELLRLKLASPATRRSHPIGGAERIASMKTLHDHHCGGADDADSDA